MTEAVFRKKAPALMNMYIRDFSLAVEDASAILGNFGHESGGLTNLQEDAYEGTNKGGYGWPQFTGDRRKDYMAYCERNGYDPASDMANYKYTWVELKGTEARAITMLKQAVGLEAKVKAFEEGYERAGVKAYESRLKWAQRALEEYSHRPNEWPEWDKVKKGEVILPDQPVKKDGQGQPHIDLVALMNTLLPLIQQLPALLALLQGQRVQPTAPTNVTVKSSNPLENGGTQLGAIGLAISTAFQSLGIIGPPAGAGSTMIGTLATLIPGIIGGVGLTGGWGAIARVAGTLVSSFFSNRSKPNV